jgi:ATP-dependent Clp protease adaptor protein ClpS
LLRLARSIAESATGTNYLLHGIAAPSSSADVAALSRFVRGGARFAGNGLRRRSRGISDDLRDAASRMNVAELTAARPHSNAWRRYRFGTESALALSWPIESIERRRAQSAGRRRVRKTNEPMPPLDVTITGRPARLADDDRKRKGGDGAPGTAVITKTRPQTKRPNLYRVLLLNDDYTPMEFVVHVLERFFNKDHEAAHRIMMHVHQHGIGECGIFTYEVAETKVTQVMDFARKHQHPLQCIMEKK